MVLIFSTKSCILRFKITSGWNRITKSDYRTTGCEYPIYGGQKMDKKQIGLRLKALRTGKGISQQELAHELNIDRTRLSKIETGEITPAAGILLELKRIFSISIDWLLTGEGLGPMESYDSDIHELLTAMHEKNAVKHAVLSFFYEYKFKYPGLFMKPGKPANIIDLV
jgi:transcriptional regulator with XRE-family HTH domain